MASFQDLKALNELILYRRMFCMQLYTLSSRDN